MKWYDRWNDVPSSKAVYSHYTQVGVIFTELQTGIMDNALTRPTFPSFIHVKPNVEISLRLHTGTIIDNDVRLGDEGSLFHFLRNDIHRHPAASKRETGFLYSIITCSI